VKARLWHTAITAVTPIGMASVWMVAATRFYRQKASKAHRGNGPDGRWQKRAFRPQYRFNMSESGGFVVEIGAGQNRCP
jgi:hypothetical protein